ncbi:hypothetical protein AJ79_07201 [Helicocarpus griseus UAMH5409]|uniref:UDP-N-acetylglucosamine transferase subunit ALG14 n=1 Tax=Helicocarpus griseus UAMH5409 TaxID=1447875 RepID=A0A2B7X5P5_9EURO|nr:hypothetical protein AJ79_07201 [Helicocarpus griseus UAMH5409]
MNLPPYLPHFGLEHRILLDININNLLDGSNNTTCTFVNNYKYLASKGFSYIINNHTKHALTNPQIAIYFNSKLHNGHDKNKKESSGRESKHQFAHILVVLGSGGHTAEMLSMLKHAPLDTDIYTRRTYVVSSGDSFSASKAMEFERYLVQQQHPSTTVKKKDAAERSLHGTDVQNEATEPSFSKTPGPSETSTPYTIVTVPRARRVHQSYLTAPLSTLHCLWVCIAVLRGVHPDQEPSSSPSSSTITPPSHPDIILTNGPATAVCIILAAKILRAFNSIFYFLAFTPFIPFPRFPARPPKRKRPRTIFVESWARVTTLSLSGKIVLPLVDRFLVQWEGLEGYSSWFGGRAEFVGALVG